VTSADPAPLTVDVPSGVKPSRVPPSRGRRIVFGAAVAVVAAILAGALWVALNPQRVTDQLAVWNFEPGSKLEGYADRDGFTDEGRFLFYASRPAISPEGEFDAVCASRTEDVGILGCYLPDDQTILLYDVTDARLDGLEEVVAAHELLHAVWDRMSQADRDALAPLLEAEVAARAGDKALSQTLAFYAKNEPAERLNELHSIVATEFNDISPELEAHYSKYFSDRSVITALHFKSNAVFEAQAKAIDDLVTEIDALAASIDADYSSYNAGYDQLNSEIDDFNSRADSGDFNSQAEFDAERAALLRRQVSLDALYASIETRVTTYDGLVAQLDGLNAVLADLNESINITPRSEGDLGKN
jgi:hypothetical protein